MSTPAPLPESRPGLRTTPAPGRPRRPLVVAPRVRPRPPRVPFVVVVALTALGGVVGLLLFNTSMQQASFAASSLEQQATALAAREQGLQMELESMRDPQRLARAARDAGMVPGGATCFLSLPDGSTSGPCTAATPEDARRIEPQPAPRPAVLTPEPRYVDPPAEQNQVGRNSSGDTARGADAPGSLAARMDGRSDRG
ncbi:hypothetical protein GCM10009737_11850 [Nocardioides lentus]|uniref:Cell division protein FtsL n=1 Tax=Nocardioides lentus TaxID=338077 RepID=A0ABP5AEP7_9ACTN